MATFAYKAISVNGQQVVDKIVARDRAAAIDELFGKDLNPVSIERLEEGQPEGLFARFGGVSKREVDAFTRQLANLLAAGVPMSRALGILSREATRIAPKKLWAIIHDQVSGGMSLADALGHHPQAFSPIYVAMVRAGETGGFLDLVLEQITTFRAREADLKNRVRAALTYPIILAVLAAVVIPNVTGMFGRGAQQAYETDQETIQTACATFYFDLHAGWRLNAWADSDEESAGHRYPNDLGDESAIYLGTSVTYEDYTVYPLLEDTDDLADDADIYDAAIWMGLLVNSPAAGTTAGSTDRDGAAVISGEKGPYLNELPDSAMAGDNFNGLPDAEGGTYCWIVGKDGKVYSAVEVQWDADPDGTGPIQANTDTWVHGFVGDYP